MNDEKGSESWEKKRAKRLQRICFRLLIATFLLKSLPILLFYLVIKNHTLFEWSHREVNGVKPFSVLLKIGMSSIYLALTCLAVYVFFLWKLIQTSQKLKQAGSEQKKENEIDFATAENRSVSDRESWR